MSFAISALLPYLYNHRLIIGKIKLEQITEAIEAIQAHDIIGRWVMTLD
jgi:D-arabinose 1-dehydrogenase-like Zn-dependent alcohol dehydrogenase